jgi:primosomal protein N' (replication factor Y)
MPKYARVLVDNSGSRTFDYEIPGEIAGEVAVGSRVRVPVKTRILLATVVELAEDSEAKHMRPIASVVGSRPILNPLLLRLANWIADYYCCSIDAALRAVLPQVIRRAQVTHKSVQFASLARAVAAEELSALEMRAPNQAAVIRVLQAAIEPMPVSRLLSAAGADRQSILSLSKKGLVQTGERTVERDPLADATFLPSARLELNQEQGAAFQQVLAAIHAPEAARPILLHGVTGSGKTEIYLQAIHSVLERGQSAIMLIPEISLTPQTVERFKSRFEETKAGVAVLHSHLSHGERHDEWHKINEGHARIVIGARSAVFAPVTNLGLIVVDEEHENTYKQEEVPGYHGRDVAVLRASMEPCAIVLGSATPSLESYHNAKNGKYQLLKLNHRVDDRRMPLIRIIDLRQESMRQKGPAILSDRLCRAIESRLERKEQSILFLNRRGFSTSLQCTICGFVAECPNCSVSLTYHRAEARIICHICGHTAKVPAKCPECGDPGIRYSGTGTEKVEDAVTRLFPKAEVKRMDADAMTRKGAFRETLYDFRTGKIDILVGTQMIAKGLHFPNVTLVGIINADLALHLPDFRAGERTFQLLTQVAGRAGRGDVEGEVFVQSFTPFSPSIQFARHHDFEGFWEQEIDFREKWGYPPFTHMVLITVRSTHLQKAEFSAETLARRLKEMVPPGVQLSRPAPAPLEKSRGQYRFHLSLRTVAILRLSRLLKMVLNKMTFPEEVVVTADVDPYHLL